MLGECTERADDERHPAAIRHIRRIAGVEKSYLLYNQGVMTIYNEFAVYGDSAVYGAYGRLMPSFFMRLRKVDSGIPRIRAAPWGPLMRPPVSSSTAWM